jgi:hypothetical protein
MDFEHGYRLKLGQLSDFTRLVAGFRTHAMRIMAASYAEQVAKTAVVALDAAALGLTQSAPDMLAAALDTVRASHDRTVDGVYAPTLNCVIAFHFVGPAVLAVMEHGDDRYRRPWEGRREVVKWGWSAAARPAHVGEAAWADRGKFWAEAAKMSAAGLGRTTFELVNGPLPAIGWNAIQKCLPDMEWRLEHCVRRLAASERRDPKTLTEKERARMRERARAGVAGELTKETFAARGTAARQPARNPPMPKTAKPRDDDEKREPADGRAAMIDHADLLVSSEGRPFLAVPYVGFRPEDRVYVQVGSKDVTFAQNGVQFGAVNGIPASARDYLRGLTTITLVEVSTNDRKRLLRARHVAMVSDISLGEGMRRPTQTFKRRTRDADIEEI